MRAQSLTTVPSAGGRAISQLLNDGWMGLAWLLRNPISVDAPQNLRCPLVGRTIEISSVTEILRNFKEKEYKAKSTLPQSDGDCAHG